MEFTHGAKNDHLGVRASRCQLLLSPLRFTMPRFVRERAFQDAVLGINIEIVEDFRHISTHDDFLYTSTISESALLFPYRAMLTSYSMPGMGTDASTFVKTNHTLFPTCQYGDQRIPEIDDRVAILFNKLTIEFADDTA